MKVVAIVSCNDNYDYETRTKYVKEYFIKIGYKVVFIVANFDHRNKCKYICTHDNENVYYVNVKEYKKNLSIDRILSHIQFAQGVIEILKTIDVDLIYHCAPPNFTIKILSKFKINHKVKIITEIGDMWPESLPVSNFIKKVCFLPLTYWSDLRNNYLYNSDYIIAECDLFKTRLMQDAQISNIDTLYFCKESNISTNLNLSNIEDEIQFCYLGSINNIIDIRFIGLLFSKLRNDRKIVLNIIGDGEKRNELIECAELNGASVKYHGMIFDEMEKREILSNNHFALNIMKDNVFVGMTMKSLDYFSFGIPLINNIKGDIWNIVNEREVGYNLSVSSIDNVAKNILDLNMNTYSIIRNNTEQTQKHYFSVLVFENKLKDVLRKIGLSDEKKEDIGI